MSLPQLIAELDDAALLQLFSNNAVAKGRGYVGRVGRIEVAGNTISAAVQGSEPRPYRTSVRLERRDFFGDVRVEIATRCTCPVGNRCKHAVALLMAARRPGALVEKPREAVLQWAAGLRKRLATKPGPTRRTARTPREAILYAIRCEPSAGSAELELYKARVDPGGAFSGGGAPWLNFDQALLRPSAFVDDADLTVLRLLRMVARDRK